MIKWAENKSVKEEALPSIGCAFVEEFFTERELLILNNLELMLGLTLSAGARKLASELDVPESTGKVILRKFRDAGLIVAGKKQRRIKDSASIPGGKQRRGTAIKVTKLGELIRWRCDKG